MVGSSGGEDYWENLLVWDERFSGDLIYLPLLIYTAAFGVAIGTWYYWDDVADYFGYDDEKEWRFKPFGRGRLGDLMMSPGGTKTTQVRDCSAQKKAYEDALANFNKLNGQLTAGQKAAKEMGAPIDYAALHALENSISAARAEMEAAKAAYEQCLGGPVPPTSGLPNGVH